MMTNKYLRILCIILLPLVTFSCANSLNELVNPPPVIEKGKKMPGDMVAYSYDLTASGTEKNVYLLNRAPVCEELQEELAVSKTRMDNLRGSSLVLTAPLIVFFPRTMGAVTDMNAHESRRNEVKRKGLVRTGRVIPCGEEKPAPDEEIIVQSSGMKIAVHMHTDSMGRLDLKKVMSMAGNEIYLNVFIKADGSIYYVKTIFLR